MSLGLLASVPSNPNGNCNGNNEVSSDVTGYSAEAARDAAAPSGKWHKTHSSSGFFITSSVVSGSEVVSKKMYLFCFYRLSDAGSLPGRLAKWCHDVHAG